MLADLRQRLAWTLQGGDGEAAGEGGDDEGAEEEVEADEPDEDDFEDDDYLQVRGGGGTSYNLLV